MRRIWRITRIAPLGMRTRNTRAGIFWELRSGCFGSPNGSLFRDKKKEKDSGERNQIATKIDPSNPFNPPHPDETSVWVACPRASYNTVPAVS